MNVQNELINTVFEPYQKPSEMFVEDSYAKKRIAINAGKKVGAGGRHVTYAYDLLSKKERKKYMKGSPVVSYNLNELMPLNAFKMLDAKKQKEILEHWFNNEIISKGKLIKYWSLTDWTLRKITDPLNLNITNPRILATIARVHEARATMTPEKWSDVVKKRQEKKDKKAQDKARKEEEQEKKAVASSPAPEKLPEQPIKQPEIISRQPEQPVYHEPQPQQYVHQANITPYYMQQTTQPMQSTFTYAGMPNVFPAYQPPAPAPLPTMGFNIANQTGAVCIDSLNRMLAFMQYDSRKLYKISVTVEEVKA